MGLLWLLALGLWVIGKVPGLVLALMVLTALLFFRRQSPDGRTVLWQMTLALIFTGLGLTLAVEVVVLKHRHRPNEHRLQVTCRSGCSGVSPRRSGQPPSPSGLRGLPLAWRTAWRTSFALLFGLVLLYPLTATGPRVDDRIEGSTERTFDGSAFMERAVFRDKEQQIPLRDDLDAIHWMEQNLPVPRSSPK